MVFKIKNRHPSTFRLLSSSRSYGVTFKNFYLHFIQNRSYIYSMYIYTNELKTHYLVALSFMLLHNRQAIQM